MKEIYRCRKEAAPRPSLTRAALRPRTTPRQGRLLWDSGWEERVTPGLDAE